VSFSLIQTSVSSSVCPLRNLPVPPQLGSPVVAKNIYSERYHGYVSGFMGDPNDKKGRYSIEITFYDGRQQYRYFSIHEKGFLWSEV
jgi:hypothetical protein